VSMDAVLKVGGSLSREHGLEALGREISRLGARYRLLVVPGGGEFADLVRAHHRRYPLSETAAHRMAILAMDQYGYLLGALIPESILVTDLLAAKRATGEGQVPILLPAELLLRADPLPHSWQVTSDSIAAWVAGLAEAPRLILLKDVSGLYTADPRRQGEARLVEEMTVAELARRQGGVDTHLARLLARGGLEVWVVDGRYPGRLAELLEKGRTLGTRIIPQQ
jgi:aspartokinase-like uncharacterized kinase